MPLVTAQERVERVAQIESGMKPTELFQLMGGPDFESYGGIGYDIDATEPYTLFVYFDSKGVERKVLSYPPDWVMGSKREAMIRR